MYNYYREIRERSSIVSTGKTRFLFYIHPVKSKRNGGLGDLTGFFDTNNNNINTIEICTQ